MELVGWRKTLVDDFEKFFSHVCFDIVVVPAIVPDYLSFSVPFRLFGVFRSTLKVLSTFDAKI